MLPAIDLVLRSIIVAAFGLAAVVAATHWAVRSRKLEPFGRWPRLVRRASDPVLLPLERRVVRLGGNPQDAPFWLLAAVVVGGLIVLWLFRFVADGIVGLYLLAHSSPRAWLVAALRLAFSALQVAIIVRVIASWFGASPAHWWMRLARRLTDWIIVPLRRVIPTVGPFDVSPIAAYFLLFLLERFLLAALV
ncbi:MAG TPA: YggT family protein [Gemmatimonadales bacterium]|nr:YggT family protein [Gemmatimonadales bacterium]